MYITARRGTGFTLIELMIGLVIGLLVTSGVLSVYISTIKSSSSTIKSSRLNQEMATLMNIMANDIRRAGYWDGGVASTPTANPFSQTDTTTPANSTALEVHAYASGAYANAGVQGNGDCVVYAYDRDADGNLDLGTTVGASAPFNDAAEGFGFRLNTARDGIVMKNGFTEVNDCSGTGENWIPMTDTSFINVTVLDFSLANSQCLNNSEPNGIVEATGAAVGVGATELFTERDCYITANAPDVGEATIEVREVLITLTASLVDDSSVVQTLRQSVQVRNNHIRQY